MADPRLLAPTARLLGFSGWMLTVIRAQGWTAERADGPLADRALKRLISLADITHTLGAIGHGLSSLGEGHPSDADASRKLLIRNCEHLEHQMVAAERRDGGIEMLPGSCFYWSEGLTPLREIIALLREGS